MTLRTCGLFLVLLCACSTTEQKPLHQVAMPWVAPLAGPKPVVMPAPMGLTPPVTIMVDPRVHPDPEAQGVGSTRRPPIPVTPNGDPKCIPERVPHLGGDDLHNQCADRVPQNGMSGFDVLVNGKRFDAVQSVARILWEIKTDNFEAYTPALRRIVIEKQVIELRRERDLAKACGYGFLVGVRSSTHLTALREAADDLTVVLMDWC
ncbi:DUF6310 domain-containing protein [Corallococcus terminator]|uniref:DUF6310 domain-containing protein n=1 Tax=Corallococcus terminator TaxID=2316733 RepID=A0A3A8JEA6_9BACT|nr:DUF6310 domain-containing protein [Corallococcus terminator]RKG94062.1 hypothetical protein D7V88_00420 [Corallococcus terminator]